MKVLIVKPKQSPVTAEIGSDLVSMQAAVGGAIQAVYPFEDPVALVCHEEGKLVGLPLNRALRDLERERSTTSSPEPSSSAPLRRTATTLTVSRKSS